MTETELAKWFDVVTRAVSRVEPLGFHLVDLDEARTEFVRVQFMIENGFNRYTVTTEEGKIKRGGVKP